MSATPFVLGIVGDSGSGKNTLADAVEALLGPERVTDLRLDDYHRFTREERAERGVTALNPIVHNFPLMREHLQLLRAGRPIRNRSYDHADGSFGPIRLIEAREIVLVRGLLGFPDEAMRSLYDLAVFLEPEPELLFRWKLRRDVLSRGYSEAEVLKHIAHHLLDAKEYVLPQSALADVVVHQELPDWDAPDSEVRTSLILRRGALAGAQESGILSLIPGIRDSAHDAGALRLQLDPALALDAADRWGAEQFPGTFRPERVGVYVDESGEHRRRAPLVVVEVLVALLARAMSQRSAAAGEREGEGE